MSTPLSKDENALILSEHDKEVLRKRLWSYYQSQVVNENTEFLSDAEYHARQTQLRQS